MARLRLPEMLTRAGCLWYCSVISESFSCCPLSTRSTSISYSRPANCRWCSLFDKGRGAAAAYKRGRAGGVRVEQDSAVAAPQRYTPRRPRYAAAAPSPLSNREHRLQLAGRLYDMEMERVLNGQQEKLPEMAEQYYRHLLESASPVSVASPSTSRARRVKRRRGRLRNYISIISGRSFWLMTRAGMLRISESVSTRPTSISYSRPANCRWCSHV